MNMKTDERLIDLLREMYGGLSELGIDCDYLDAAADRPLPSVLVQAPPDDAGRERVILLAFVPDEEILEEIDLLQLYMPLPFLSPGEALVGRLGQINRQAALGHAGIMEDGEVYWRHIWPLPRGMPIIPQVLFEVMQFFLFSAELGSALLVGRPSED